MNRLFLISLAIAAIVAVASARCNDRECYDRCGQVCNREGVCPCRGVRQTSHCTSDADCPDADCGHHQVNECTSMHGTGGGIGEMYCQCVKA